MKKFTNAVAVLLAVCICFMVSACGVGYHAAVMDSDIEFTSEFLKNSITYGAWCDNEDFDPETDEYGNHGWYDSKSPETRTYIIKEQSEADEIFVKLPDVDFENEMVLVYCWTEIYIRDVILKSVKADDGDVLKIEFTLKEPSRHVGDATIPQRRILAVRIDKLDISSVEFSQI